MRAMLVAAVAAMGASACGGTTGQVKPPAEDTGPKVAAYWQLPEGEGVIVAETAGGTVPMRVVETGETIVIADGEPVELKQLFAGEGLGRADAEVLARGQVGVVPNTRVALRHRLLQPAGASFAVFTAVSACSPDCKSDIWLLGQDGWRARVTAEATSAPSRVVVNPKRHQVAIGGHGLWVVAVPSGKAQHWDEFTSPTYGQYGSLYVRGVGPDDSVYELGEFGNGVLLFTEPGSPPSASHGRPAPDAAPIRFATDGKTVHATFVRKGKKIEREISR